MLESLGARHVQYGVDEAQYEAVRAALIAALGDTLGDDFDPETEAAWNTAFELTASVMKTGAAEAREAAAATVETLRDT